MQTKKNLPIAIIVIGVALAAGVAFLLRQSDAGEAPPKPNAPTPVVNIAGAHVKGSPNAKATLVEFGDFQCPSCAYYYPMVESLLKEHPDLVKLEFHHYPLIQMHPNALPAALAAEAAAEQGKFWEMYSLLFESQSGWSTKSNAEEDFLVMAQRLGLDSNKFMQAMKAPETLNRVTQDVTRGGEAHVEGTPSFYVNGRAIRPLPQSVQAFKKAIEDGLATK